MSTSNHNEAGTMPDRSNILDYDGWAPCGHLYSSMPQQASTRHVPHGLHLAFCYAPTSESSPAVQNYIPHASNYAIDQDVTASSATFPTYSVMKASSDSMSPFSTNALHSSLPADPNFIDRQLPNPVANNDRVSVQNSSRDSLVWGSDSSSTTSVPSLLSVEASDPRRLSGSTSSMRDFRATPSRLRSTSNASAVSPSDMIPMYQTSTGHNSNNRASNTTMAPPSYILPGIGRSQFQRVHSSTDLGNLGDNPTRSATYSPPSDGVMPLLSAQRFYPSPQGRSESNEGIHGYQTNRDASSTVRNQGPRTSS